MPNMFYTSVLHINKKHSSTQSAKLLFVYLILTWKKMKNETNRWNIIQVQTMKKNKRSREKAFKYTICKTAFCCNSNLKEIEEWNIQERKHSTAHPEKLLAFVILIRKNTKNKRYRGKSIQVHTMQHYFLL